MIVQSFLVVAPLFILIALGFGAVRLRLMSGEASAGLSEFVFGMAIPALLFRTVATAEMPSVDPLGYWFAYFAALALVWMAAAFMARRLGRDPAEATIIGFAAGQSNTVLIGIPLILATFGEAGKVPIVLLVGVHLPLTMTIATLLIARGAERGGPSALIRSLATNPILLALAAGAAWRLTGLGIHPIALSVLTFLGHTAGPCALIALGMSLSQVSLGGSISLIALASLLKLAVQPALVYLIATSLFALPPVWLAAAVLFAACPTGVNAFLLAERHGRAEAVVSGTIAATTLLAILTLTLMVALLMPIAR